MVAIFWLAELPGTRLSPIFGSGLQLQAWAMQVAMPWGLRLSRDPMANPLWSMGEHFSKSPAILTTPQAAPSFSNASPQPPPPRRPPSSPPCPGEPALTMQPISVCAASPLLQEELLPSGSSGFSATCLYLLNLPLSNFLGSTRTNTKSLCLPQLSFARSLKKKHSLYKLGM